MTRIAYYRDTALTGPEHAHLSDALLLHIAIEEAQRADLIGPEYPQVTEEDMRAGIRIIDTDA